MEKFRGVLLEHEGLLKQYVPVVARVHGSHHPEFYEVKALYDEMIEKTNQNNFKLDDVFQKLNTVTSNYKIPSDTCETYEAVYKMLESLELAYYLK